ncbi:MAG: DMT family transporter, partial [Anaerotignum sp.]|nr:DMT family transporter [Anaerotignum sp.]
IMQLGMGAIVLSPYVMLTQDFGEATLSMTPSLWALLLFVGLVHTGVAYALYFDSMKDLKAQTLAIFSYIDPIVAIILSALLLKESMGLYGVIGAVLVLGSTFISELPEKERN